MFDDTVDSEVVRIDAQLFDHLPGLIDVFCFVNVKPHTRLIVPRLYENVILVIHFTKPPYYRRRRKRIVGIDRISAVCLERLAATLLCARIEATLPAIAAAAREFVLCPSC